MTYSETPLVGIVMGSDTDRHVMQHAANVLDNFSVPYESDILSAHRSPERVVKYARLVSKKGLHVIIAGAGGSAALPGHLASYTDIPILGVAIPDSHGNIENAINSMIYLPKSTPVEFMGCYEEGAEKAALGAIRHLGQTHPDLRKTHHQFRMKLAKEVAAKGELLRKVGFDNRFDNH